MRKLFVFQLLSFLFTYTFGQVNAGDSLKSVGCGTVTESDIMKINYTGVVYYEKKPVVNTKIQFCHINDTTIVFTNHSGLFKTMLSINNKERPKSFPKIIIENTIYNNYQFQLTEFHFDTIPKNYIHHITLTKKTHPY